MKRNLMLAALSLFAWQSAGAIPVFLDLESDGAAGPALEDFGTFSTTGVTINATATGGDLNSLSQSFGVDGPDGSAIDDSDQIDAALSESIDFEFVFSPAITVEIISLDFVGVGAANAGDAVFFAINGGAAITLETGVTGFSGSSDLYTPPTPISLSSGDVLTITSEDIAGIEGITLEVAIPEPVGATLALLGCVAIPGRRRRG